jgi:hypothetical protein
VVARWIEIPGGLTPIVLPVAALLGPSFDHRLLSTLLGVPAWDVAAELNRSRAAGIFTECPGGWTFAHDAMRNALVASAAPGHRRIAAEYTALEAERSAPLGLAPSSVTVAA